MRNWFDILRLQTARLKLDLPSRPILPQFRLTFLFLWLLAFIGLGYGHIFSRTESARTISLMLTSVSTIAALIIVLLNNPWEHLKLFVAQCVTLVLLALFVLVLLVGYAFLAVLPSVSTSVQYAWGGGALIFLVLVLGMVLSYFVRVSVTVPSYPGRRSAPLLFAVLLINLVWWYWPTVVAWFAI